MKSQKKTVPVAADPRETDVVNWASTFSITLILIGLLTIWGGEWAGQHAPLVLALMLLAYVLSMLAVIDVRYGILPHMLTGTLFVLGVALAPTFGHTYGMAALSGVVAFGGLLLCAMITRVLTGKDSLGGGDLWLVLGLGAWIGLAGLPFFLMATAVTGAISVGLKRWLTQGYAVITEHEAQKFAFGPALCVAGWLAVLYGGWYWRVMDMLIAPAS